MKIINVSFILQGKQRHMDFLANPKIPLGEKYQIPITGAPPSETEM